MRTLLMCSAVALTTTLHGQSANPPKLTTPVASTTYSTAIGVRAGGTSGITVKHFLSGSEALEVILGLWYHGFSITGLYERHAPAKVSALKWYYGIGAHVAVETEREWHRWRDEWWVRGRTDAVGLGIDGILGIEYKIPPIPFAISLDVKPFIEVLSSGGVIGSLDPGLGIKIAF